MRGPVGVSAGDLEVRRGGLAAAAVLLEVEIDGLALVQARETRLLDRGDVDEDVLTAAIGLDEAETLGGVEPLHLAGAGAGNNAARTSAAAAAEAAAAATATAAAAVAAAAIAAAAIAAAAVATAITAAAAAVAAAITAAA